MTLHVAISGWLLGEPSGANRRLLSLLANVAPLLAGDERITVLHTPAFVPPALPRVSWRSVPIAAAPMWRRIVDERRVLGRCLRAIGATVYDHGLLPLPRVPVPTTFLLHDPRAADGRTRLPRWLARRVLRSACSRAAAVVVPSEWTAARVRELAPNTRRVVVVPNAADAPPAVIPPVPPGVPANGYLLHVGHLEARKNLDVVVRALGDVQLESRPELWLAGRDAGAWPHLQALAERTGCRAHVRALGIVDDATLRSLYAHARAVVVPSTYEGFGMPVLEAFAHGVSVLASRATALPEVVGDAGVLLPPHDVAAWTRAIVGLASTDSPASRSARVARAATFSWRASASLLLETWRRAAGTNSMR